MIEQMPDEVWTDNPLMGSGVYMLRPCGVCLYRHIRADLYERAEAERDRLREAVSEAKRRIGIYLDDECSYDETLEMGRFVLDAFHGLQEALDHD